VASLIYTPPSGGNLGAVEVRVTGGTYMYTFTPGVPQDVLPEHVADVTATLQALAGTVAAVAQPTVAVVGTPGSTTYGYKVVAVTADGDTVPSTERQVTTGNATLDGTNKNRITWVAPTALAGTITGYKVLRSTGGAAQGRIATVAANVLTLDDTGLTAAAYTPAVAAPGQIAVATGPDEL
jgi:hypothetical protein